MAQSEAQGTASETVRDTTVDSFLKTAAFMQKIPPGLQAASLSTQAVGYSHYNEEGTAALPLMSDEIQQAVKEQMNRFQKALQTFELEAKKKYKSDLKLKAHYTLADIIEHITTLHLQQEKRKDFWGRLLHGFREFGNKSTIYRQWLELLPTQSKYLSVLCGGLKLIINAMQRMRKVREEISQTLETLPSLLLCTATTDQIFMNSELHVSSMKILGKTFDVLRCVILQLLRSAASTLVKAVLQQDMYAEELENSLDQMQQLHEEYNRVATTCSYQAIHNIETSVHKLPEQVAQEHRMTRTCIQNEMRDQINLLQLTFTKLCDGLYADRVAFERGLLDQLLKQVGAAPIIDAHRLHEEVLQMLGFDLDNHISEAVVIKTQIWRSPSEAQDRLSVLLKEERFISWSTTPDPPVLFINEHRKFHGNSSAGSHLCAKMIESMQGESTGQVHRCFTPICINYFCSQHKQGDYSEYCGPNDMLRALIGQLICAHHSLDLRKTHRWLRKGYQDDPRYLWRVFEMLVRQLPPQTPLFCLVDNVTVFEVSECREEAIRFVEQLRDLCATLSADRILKVLLTSPESSRLLYRSVDEDAVIDLPQSVPKLGNISYDFLRLRDDMLHSNQP